jgi:hypothetical protein
MSETAITKTTNYLPAEFAAQFAVDAEKHQEQLTAAAVTIPILRVAQSNSPQVDPGDAKHLPGLKVGDLFIGITGENFGSKCTIVPVHFEEQWQSYRKRELGGGFRGIVPAPRDVDPRKTSKIDDPTDPAGEIVYIHQHLVIVVREDIGEVFPAVLSLTSSGLTASKTINTVISQKRVKVGDRLISPPRYSLAFDLSTARKENEKGKWYALVAHGHSFGSQGSLLPFDNAFWKSVYDSARELRESATKGDVKIERDEAAPSEESGTGEQAVQPSEGQLF